MIYANDLLRHNNMHTWLELEAVATGSEAQQASYRDGRMSEAELRRLARDQLFAPFIAATARGELVRWQPMPWSEVDHKRSGCIGRVDFRKHAVMGPVGRIAELAELGSRHEWMRRTGGRFQIVTYQHVGECQKCHATAEKLSAHVSVLWAGRSLALEYAI